MVDRPNSFHSIGSRHGCSADQATGERLSMHEAMHEFLHRLDTNASLPSPSLEAATLAPEPPFASDGRNSDAAAGGAAETPDLRQAEHSATARNIYLLEATERLSTALLHVVHQPTAKGRDRSLAALVALIYGPTPFGGVNTLKDVAMRYGMTEQNLFQLMRGHRELLERAAEPEYEI
jgi:hypothetical protein